jgi:hypothetical protein
MKSGDGYRSSMRVLALCLLAVGLACRPSEVTLPLPADSAGVGVDATVEFLNVEGGCWALKVSGQHYQPTNLANEFKQDGLRVRVTMRTRDDMASVCMIGPIVQIVSIRRL